MCRYRIQAKTQWITVYLKPAEQIYLKGIEIACNFKIITGLQYMFCPGSEELPEPISIKCTFQHWIKENRKTRCAPITAYSQSKLHTFLPFTFYLGIHLLFVQTEFGV